MKRRRISAKLARYGVVAAVLLGLAMSAVQIFRDFANEEANLKLTVGNILGMAGPPAVAAARLLDDTQAAQLVDGLMTYDFVVEARLVSDLGEVLAARNAPHGRSTAHSLTDYISGGLAEYSVTLVDTARGDAVYGQLIMVVDPSLALAGFFERSWFIIGAGILRNLLFALVLFAIFHWLLTKPLLSLIASFRAVDPRDPGGQRLSTGQGHMDDELSLLAEVGNEYFAASERHLKMRSETEAALRESEQRFKDMAEVSADWFWEMDADLRFTYMSPSIASLGATPEDFVGKTRADLLGSRYDPDNLDEQDQLLKAHKAFRGVERQSDISMRWTRNSAIPLFSEDGEFMGYRGTSSDITDQKDHEEQARQSQKMEAVGQLTGGVAHDFNNLLAVIMGNAEIIQDRRRRGEAFNEAMIETILRSAGRGAELTHRLLAFSRRQVLEPKLIDLSAVLPDIIVILRRTLGETIELKMLEAPELWACEADPGQLENALLNLAINARDAMPQGGILTIETSNIDLGEEYTATEDDLIPGEYVMLAVSDTGTGMTDETLAHVFEPFYTTKDVGRGSGLGLSMVFGFAKQSGGHVTIYSEVGVGTTVKLYLPRASRATAEAAATVSLDPQGGQGERVLVVEDDEDVRVLAVEMLGSLGYDVLQAEDGASALALLGSEPNISLLLTDVVLPGGVSGPKIAEQAAEIVADIRILYMSGYTENAVVHHGRLDDGVSLLQKPFTRNALAGKIRTALDG